MQKLMNQIPSRSPSECSESKKLLADHLVAWRISKHPGDKLHKKFIDHDFGLYEMLLATEMDLLDTYLDEMGLADVLKLLLSISINRLIYDQVIN